MSVVAEHDYVGRVREELAALEADLRERGVREALAQVTQRLDLPPDLALAAAFRAARRSGLSLGLMLTEITNQLDRAARPGG